MNAWLIGGYAGLAGFFGVEGTTREPGNAASLVAVESDQGTTRRIVIAYVLVAVLAPALRRVRSGRLPTVSGPLGLSLQAFGLWLRARSMRTFGRSYARTLRTEKAQQLVDTGPYCYVRHPGYLASLLIWLGFALTSGSFPVVALTALLIGRAYERRIAAEEHMLLRDLPGYAAYMERTKRLVPWIW